MMPRPNTSTPTYRLQPGSSCSVRWTCGSRVLSMFQLLALTVWLSQASVFSARPMAGHWLRWIATAEQCSAVSPCQESLTPECTIRRWLAYTWLSDRRESSALSTNSAWRHWRKFRLSSGLIPLVGTRIPARSMHFFLAAGAPRYSLNSKIIKNEEGEMAISKAEPAERLHDDENSVQKGIGLWPLTGYFLKLGTIGFGGPAALVGFMHRDLVEQRRWITEDTYKLSLALAQIMPGPLAAQTAI